MSRPNAKEAYNTLSDFANNFNSDDEDFVKEFLRDHRTLQQSVGKIMIQCLEAMAELPDNRIDARNKCLRDTARKMVQSYKNETGFNPSNLPTI